MPLKRTFQGDALGGIGACSFQNIDRRIYLDRANIYNRLRFGNEQSFPLVQGDKEKIINRISVGHFALVYILLALSLPKAYECIPHQRTTSLTCLRTPATSAALFFCIGQCQDHILFNKV